MPECTHTPSVVCVCERGRCRKITRRGWWEGSTWIVTLHSGGNKEKETHTHRASGRCGGDGRLCGRVGWFLSYGWFLFLSVCVRSCYPVWLVSLASSSSRHTKKELTFKCGKESKKKKSLFILFRFFVTNSRPEKRSHRKEITGPPLEKWTTTIKVFGDQAIFIYDGNKERKGICFGTSSCWNPSTPMQLLHTGAIYLLHN